MSEPEFDPNEERDWIIIGPPTPKARKLLKLYGFTRGKDGAWSRKSGERPAREMDIIMAAQSGEDEDAFY